MSRTACGLLACVAVTLAALNSWPAGPVPGSPAFAQQAAASAAIRERAADIVARIRRADYEGNREALRSLVERLSTERVDRTLAARVYYWRGFGLWRRALNGFNQTADPKDIAADLERAVAEFEQAASLDSAFADAKIGLVSCLQNLAFIHRADAAITAGIVARFLPLFKELAATAADNPRFLWVQGASLWYALPGLSEAEIATRRSRALATYERGVQLARTTPAPRDPMEPSWGEPELLMNLAWSRLNARSPDFVAAEAYARQALALVPHWQYVRDVLLPQIQQTRAQRRLDVFVGRWTAKGRPHLDTDGEVAAETAGVVINRRTARGNWLLSEVTLDGVSAYGVTVMMAPTPDGSYVAVAVNNLVPAPLQYSGRWLDDRVLELETSAPAGGRRQRVRCTIVSDVQLEFLVTESRDSGRSYVRHSSMTLTREPHR